MPTPYEAAKNEGRIMKKIAMCSKFLIHKAHPRLLIVDDQPINIHLMHQAFPPHYEVFVATHGEQALDMCAKSTFDIILLDILMPGMTGLELCRRLKSNPDTQDIPIIFVTALQSIEEETACWEAGGVDFVTKPVNLTTLRNRVIAHLTLKFQNEYLRELAMIDGLTHIANRRAFDERILIEFNRSQRKKTPLGIIVLDVDDFKRYNDKYGHQAGDACLVKIAAKLQSILNRATDLVARYGGEEFICILPDTDKKGIQFIAEKLRKAVQSLKLKNANSTVASVVTMSLGCAIYPDTLYKSYQDMIEAADKCLYQAKSKGRNQVSGPN